MDKIRIWKKGLTYSLICFFSFAAGESTCDYCTTNFLPTNSRPDSSTFKKYLNFFLQDNPDPTCSKAGHAAYSQVSSYNVKPYQTSSKYLWYMSELIIFICCNKPSVKYKQNQPDKNTQHY